MSHDAEEGSRVHGLKRGRDERTWVCKQAVTVPMQKREGSRNEQ